MRTFAVAVAATSSALSATVLSAAAHAPPAQASADLDYEGQAVTVSNVHRTLNGLLPLRPDACLARFAQRHAGRMAAQQRVFHQSLAPIIRRCDLTSVGENVAFGYRNGRTVVNQGWMRSEAHRANILDSEFRRVSVGAVRSLNGRWYTTQVLGRR